MIERRIAVLIGNGSFKYSPDIQNLRCPENDVAGLAKIFKDRSKGAFDEVIELVNKDAQIVKQELYRKLIKAERDDLFVVYYSGHGKLNRAGKLYLVAADTHPDELEPTSIGVSEIIEYMRTSNCKKIGLILDCCYSGAITSGLFAKGDRQEVDAQLRQASGYGVRVMTASTAIQTAAELESDHNSLLTKHLIGGLSTGEADELFTGRIVFSDLFHYARSRVIKEGSQEPTITEVDARDEFVISFGGRNSRKNRADIIGNKLTGLAATEVIPKDMLAEAMAILLVDASALTFAQKELDNLLEEFHSNRLSIPALIFKWGKISSKNALFHNSNSASVALDGVRTETDQKVYSRHLKLGVRFLTVLLAVLLISGLTVTLISSVYRSWDKDPDRGAMAIENGLFAETYEKPTYLNQGWDPSESLRFYNTTIGSNLLPTDFFLALEVADSNTLFKDPQVFDRYRFLPQKPTFFNPEGLAVGFVKDTFQDKSYIGFTCAACHTGQINYHGKAIRIDGGASLADYEGYLNALYQSLNKTQENPEKKKRFIERVLSINNDYSDPIQIESDLKRYSNKILNNLRVNYSNVEPGYARLDMLGHINNKVAQLITPYQKVKHVLTIVKDASGKDLLTDGQINKVLEGIPTIPLNDVHYGALFARLQSPKTGYPNLSQKNILRISSNLFPTSNAPVSIPALWDSTQSDFLMWDGRIQSAGIGSFASNVQKSAAVFASVDIAAEENGDGNFSLSAYLTGNSMVKISALKLLSSIDQGNLNRLEAQLESLKSPTWPVEFGVIDPNKSKRGERIYATHCIDCHNVGKRSNYGHSKTEMVDMPSIGTDSSAAMANFQKGYSGILEDTIQQVPNGNIRVGRTEYRSVLAAGLTKVLIATPDSGQSFFHRFFENLSLMSLSFFRNVSVPVLNDSSAAYKARPLNGVWATAPYLHNGSVPSLYELLLPPKPLDSEVQANDQFRPDVFMLGSREFDPIKVGYKSSGYDGFKFNTLILGNTNSGHLYGTQLSEVDRWDLLEYLKTL
jgi:hypothetical protein